jgi:AcrR family transcriptional regulator
MAERGRRSPRISGEDRELAILATAEALLATRALDDISIEELATGAGISRSNFYFYFESKDAVLLALLDRVIAEVQDRVADLPRGFGIPGPADDPFAAWRRSIGVFVDVFSSHRAVASAALASQHRNAEARELWSRSMEAWTDYATEVILAERARGAAPDGIDAHDLATALDLMNERVIASALSEQSPSVATDRLLDVLTHIWIQSIYGTVPAND